MNFSSFSILLLAIYVILSLINCTKIKYFAKKKFELFTKPLILIALMIFYLSMLRNNVPAPQKQWAICTAMVFYAIGDFCLIWKTRLRIFGFGVFCFLVGHIFYSTFILRLKISHSFIAAAIMLAVLIPALLLLKRKLNKTDDPMADKMFPYSFFLGFFLICIASTFGHQNYLGSGLAILGGLIFSISDSMIGIRATGQKILPGESVMITYTIGNLLLVTGVLLLQI